jgi:hypothetical protein
LVFTPMGVYASITQRLGVFITVGHQIDQQEPPVQ